ncbi:MAG: phosphomannomutase/phosphoglucomutase [Pseudomonadota bacterium]
MEQTHQFHPSLIRAYDMRGIVDETLHLEDARALGTALGRAVLESGKRPSAVVGYDARLSSHELEESLTKGLVRAGLHVQRLGLCASPELYFASQHLQASLAIMVTGSHNPPEYNGFKLLFDNKPLFGETLQAMLQPHLALLPQPPQPLSHNEVDVHCSRPDIRTPYIAELCALVRPVRRLKIAWDPANAALCPALAALCAETKTMFDHCIINGESDGSFPAHHPDPSKASNLQQLIATVMAEECDFGIAFDGDGDRIVAIDEQGRIVSANQLIALYAQDVLQHHPGAAIVADVKCSNMLFEYINKLGGQSIMAKTGHSLIRQRMFDTGARLAGEASGHIFFADCHGGYDDALYAAIRLINICGQGTTSLSELCAALPENRATPEIRLEVPESQKFSIVSQIADDLRTRQIPFNDLDGVRVNTSYGWWLIRASNTENSLTLVAESYSANDAGAVLQAINDALAPFSIAITANQLV